MTSKAAIALVKARRIRADDLGDIKELRQTERKQILGLLTWVREHIVLSGSLNDNVLNQGPHDITQRSG